MLDIIIIIIFFSVTVIYIKNNLSKRKTLKKKKSSLSWNLFTLKLLESKCLKVLKHKHVSSLYICSSVLKHSSD